LPTCFEKITDQEKGRRAIAQLQRYLAVRTNGATREDLKILAKEVAEHLDRIAIPDEPNAIEN